MTEARADGSTAKSSYDPAGNGADRCYWAPSVTVGSCYEVGHAGWTNPPTSSTSTTSDARNQRIGLVDGATNETTTYDPDHLYQVKAVYLPTIADLSHEHQTLATYDSRHRLTGITQQLCVVSTGHSCSTSTPTGSDTYLYDDNDNRTKVVEDNGAVSSDYRYCYDALDQLIYRNTGAACSSGSNDEAWTYDDAGNRLTAKTGGVTTNFAYTSEGVLCDVETAPTAASCTGGNVTSDSAGRISSYNGWTYGYDAAGRLVSACKSPTCAAGYDKVTFAYDGEGHRTQAVETSAIGSVVSRTYRYHGETVVEELTNGSTTRAYIADGAGRVTKVVVPAGQADSGTYLVLWNGHGDTLNLQRINADGSLTIANVFSYSSWGDVATSTQNGVGDLGFRYGYNGIGDVVRDGAFSLGLLYMHSREYSPSLGQFLAPDKARGDPGLYAYATSNPVNRSDSDGRTSIWIPNPYGCYGRSDNPHGSRHVSGTVAAQAVTYCDVALPSMKVAAKLLQQNCFWLICWWSKVDEKKENLRRGGWFNVKVVVSVTCNNDAPHLFRIESHPPGRSSKNSGSAPKGIRTPDLHLERVAS
jgi:RHS repeat-associated protein